MEKPNKDYSLKDIEDLLRSAVFDTFECKNCGSPLEPDAEFCGLCGWKNPLRDLGFI